MLGSKYRLHAYLGQEFIATLSLTHENELNFFYHDTWQQQGFAISPHLPLDNSAATSQFSIKTFFQNLFPEGENFNILLENFHLSRHNIFAMTQALGLDLPGALQLIPEKETLPTQTSFRRIHPFEIAERLKNYDVRNLVVWDGKPRLSVAGVHQKINIVVNENHELGFGEGQLCSTHILKFENTMNQHLVMNEFLMMKLAKSIGLMAADVELKYFEKYPTLLVKRFDRSFEKNYVKRRQIIDACQALNLPPEYKYERNLGSGRDVKHIREGANLPALFSFCDTCRNPVIAKKQLLEWTLFNLIIGNLDAHAKNISFFVSSAGIEMAPAYDLVCVRVYPEFTQELAMALGDEFDADTINAYQIADFAECCHLSRAIVAKTLVHLCEKISLELPKMVHMQETAADEHFMKKLTDCIDKQLTHLQAEAPLITSISL